MYLGNKEVHPVTQGCAWVSVLSHLLAAPIESTRILRKAYEQQRGKDAQLLLAGDARISDEIVLADADTLMMLRGTLRGVSVPKDINKSYRIVTRTGVSVVCADTARFVVRQRGCMLPEDLLGEYVAVRREDDIGGPSNQWEQVTQVDELGWFKAVDLIFAGGNSFWTGEKRGAYLLQRAT